MSIDAPFYGPTPRTAQLAWTIVDGSRHVTLHIQGNFAVLLGAWPDPAPPGHVVRRALRSSVAEMLRMWRRPRMHVRSVASVRAWASVRAQPGAHAVEARVLPLIPLGGRRTYVRDPNAAEAEATTVRHHRAARERVQRLHGNGQLKEPPKRPESTWGRFQYSVLRFPATHRIENAHGAHGRARRSAGRRCLWQLVPWSSSVCRRTARTNRSMLL